VILTTSAAPASAEAQGNVLAGGPVVARPGSGDPGGQGSLLPASDLLGERDAWHLLRRAGFGTTVREVAKFAGLSRAVAVDVLLAVKPSAARAPAAPAAGLEALAGMQAWWLRRMASPRSRLQEKMVLFWHDHFPSAVAVLNRIEALTEQNAMFRFHGLGPLRELLHQVTRNRAMLEYLDGRRNRVGAVNENYGRELMELFTLGPRDESGSGNYQQADVMMLARALTGFTYDEHAKKPSVYLAPERFDALDKVLFSGRPFQHDGVLGMENPDGTLYSPEINVLDALFAHRDSLGRPTLARFMVRKLWAWFATPDCDDDLVTEFASGFVSSGYRVSELLRSLLTHDAFYTEEARSSTTKTPVDFALQALLALGAKPNWSTLSRSLRRMGMDLFDPPGVEGWSHGAAWLATSRYLGRMELAQWIASGRTPKTGFKFRPKLAPGATPTSLVDDALAQLGLEVSPATHQRLIDYLSGGEFGSESWYEMKLRGLFALLLSLPEFQVH
jgi:uncharacterized protein (DUF1800 family)